MYGLAFYTKNLYKESNIMSYTSHGGVGKFIWLMGMKSNMYEKESTLVSKKEIRCVIQEKMIFTFMKRRFFKVHFLIIVALFVCFGNGLVAGSESDLNDLTSYMNIDNPSFQANFPKDNLEGTLHGENYIPGRLLVKYSTDSVSSDILLHAQQDLMASTHSKQLIDYSLYGLQGLQLLSTAGDMKEVMQVYEKSPLIEYVEPDYIVTIDAIPNDPGFPQLWGLHNTGQSGGVPDTDIDAPEAWDLSTGSSSVIIAVIDTGVDYTHEDLADNMWVNTNEIPENGIDDDGNGFIDDYRGWDFYNNDNDPMDDHSHGTHCAGTIAGIGNNSIGVTGVNWQAKIMPLKFIGSDGSGPTSAAILSILYANQMGAHVISNSWGGGGYSQALKDAIDASPAVVVCAAGNDAADNDIDPHYPSSYDSSNIIAVASINRYNDLSSFSNYGLTSVDLGAPGSSIYSTIPGNGYDTYNGTSMATPHVSGVAGLVKAYHPGMSTSQIIEAILNTVDPVPALDGKTVTGGRLNAFRALQYISPTPTVTPTPTPTVTPTPSQYYSFDVQSDPIGWVDPSGIFTVTANSNQTIRMKPSAGAMIKNLTVNGVEVSPKPESNYTIENVDRDYTIRLNNEPLPGVIIAAFDAASDDGYSVTFTDASFGSPKAWTWDFGDGTTATGNQVMHTYTKDGVYRVILWVRSDLAQSQVVGEIHIPLQIDQGSSLFFKS